ncbi:MAG: HEAT repeat domain-containing protein [Anaerolineae bacterium]
MTDPDPVAIRQALSELRDVSKEKRRTAVMKLGMLGGEEALRTLMLVVNNPNEDIIVRGRAALMLGKLGDARAVDPLIEALDDSGYQTRLNAAEALGKIGDPRAIKALLRVTESDHDTVGDAARTALEKLGYGQPAKANENEETETAQA